MAQGRGSSSGKSSSGRSSSGRTSQSKNTAAGRGTAGRTSTSARKSASGSRSVKTGAAKEQEHQELMQIKRKRQSVAVILFALAVLMLVLVLFPGIGGGLSETVYGLFGVSSIIWCIVLFYISVLLALDRAESNIGIKIAEAISAVLLISVFFYVISPISEDMKGQDLIGLIGSLYARGRDCTHLERGTGLIGGLFGYVFVRIFDRVLSAIIVILAAFVMVMLLTQTGLLQLFKSVSQPVRSAAERAQERAAARDAEREAQRVRKGGSDPYNELRSSKKYFDVDVPIDDSPVRKKEEKSPAADDEQPKRRKRSSSVVQDVVNELAAEQKSKPEAKPETAPDFDEKNESKPASANDPAGDDDFEALLQRVAGPKSKKQRAEEIAREAVDFANQVSSAEEPAAAEYRFPPVDLLVPQDNSEEGDIRSELKSNAEHLVETLAEYNVSASVVDISRGPAVTRYELKPAPGVKISKVTSLAGDIALRLAAQSIRIEAPIPGKAAIGVEIPNQKRSIVRIRELIDSEQFRSAKSSVTVAIGRDIEGNIILADLAKMPHLLIAGSTGMGKSVCMNSMLVSLIYKSSPDDVRLIMVDPKKVELDVYNGIPHLLVPVVCDPKKAAGALQWAVTEMDKRYALLNEHGVRNIDGYNALAAKDDSIEKMPRIVIVIDEMADLMNTSPKEVESSIARLAAMARAAGMHMVLATQRPSVDVITGTIKNNIPSRIAFKTSSHIDSRTILDEAGAESLVGMGDMLFSPVGIPKPKRVQGCFVDDPEVEKIVSFIKENGSADYDENITREIERNVAESAESKGSSAGDDSDSRDEDPMFVKAIEAVIEAGQASTSMLQRRLGVGYARAGRLIDQLAEKGIIGPFEGSKPRKVLMTRQEFLEMSMSRDSVPQAEPQLSILNPEVIEDDSFDEPPF